MLQSFMASMMVLGELPAKRLLQETPMKHEKRLFVIVIFLTMILLSGSARFGSAASAGISFDDAVKTLEGLSPRDRLARVQKEAQREGKVIWTAGRDLERMEPFLRAWEKKYPGIRLEYRRYSGRVVAERVLREYQAGKYTVDIVAPTATTFSAVKDAGVIRPYFSPEATRLRSEMRDPKGYWISTTSTPLSIYCNRNRVTTLPKDWTDFTQPRWKGDFSIDTDRVPWFYGLRKAYGDEAAKKLIGDYIKNGVLRRRGGSLQVQLVAAGEYSCALGGFLHSAVLLKQTGAPIEYVVPEPVLITPSIYLMAKFPPNPYAAILLYDYLASVEGIAHDTNSNAVLPAREDAPVVEEIKLLQKKKTLFMDVEQESRDYNQTRDMYNALLK
jgi:iron(III) transport system substrate-binding protein